MGLMDDLLSAASTLGTVVDTPAAGVRALAAGRNPLEALIDPSKRVSGRDVLQHWGVVGGNTPGIDIGDALGFAADIALDPLNLIGGGVLTKAVKGLRAAKASNKASKAARAAGQMPEEIAKLTKIVDESGKPLRTYHGTPHSFDVHDLSKSRPADIFGKTVWTSDTPKTANRYAGGDNPRIMMHFIDARNPLDMRKNFKDFDAIQTKALSSVPKHDVVGQGEATNKLLKEAGYDAVIDPDMERSIVAFHPSQIYKPYIAPALVPERHARAMSILATLLAHNAAKQARQYGGI